ncbi:MAG: hypothetical protein U5L72_17395 [Bacteroidales bacterium]|nr:hypothetical protein [Bacteroidales bacterium]
MIRTVFWRPFSGSGTNEQKGEAERSEALFGNERILIFRGVTGVIFIDPDDVMFITADGNYSNFNFDSGRD